MSEAAVQRTVTEIQADLERTRSELTGSVDELAEMLDPRIKIAEAKANIKAAADEATASFKASTKGFVDDVKKGDPAAIGIAGGTVVTSAVLIAVMVKRGR